MNSDPAVSLLLEERVSAVLKDGVLEDVTPDTVFELIRDIKDPEHPYTLEQLKVVSKRDIDVGLVEADGVAPSAGLPVKCIRVLFRPTIPHCSMAAIIGLCIKVHLGRVTRDHFVQVHIAEGMHVNFKALNKQLDDKDRVLAALENEALMDVMEECLPGL